MKKVFILLAMTIVILAEMPNTVSYRGQLTDETGNALDATVNITFDIFDVATGGTSLWSETQSVSVTDGYFDVELGSVTALDLNFDSQYWVELTIDTETLSPRDKLTPTAYSIRSNIANKADSSIYSVSSSADHEGRIGHVRFIPGEGGSITEAAATSETDTIYIAIGGGTAGSAGAAYPMANMNFGQNFYDNDDITNQVVYTVPTGSVFYLYGAQLNITTRDNARGTCFLNLYDGSTSSVLIQTSSSGYVSSYGASLLGSPVVINFNPPLRIEQGDQIRFTYDGLSTSYYMYFGYSFYGWEGTE